MLIYGVEMELLFYFGSLLIGIAFAIALRKHKVLRAGDPEGLEWLWYVMTPLIWPYLLLVMITAKLSSVRTHLRGAARNRRERRWYDFLL